MTSEAAERMMRTIDGDRDDLVALCLKLGNSRDYAGFELEVGQKVVEWFTEAGIPAFLQHITDESVNAVGMLAGADDRASGGRSLILNAHMDTQGGVPSGGPEVERRFRGAWAEGDELFGRGLANDKAVLCAQMLAARAIKKADISLKCDLTVTGVAQETSSPVVSRDGSRLPFRPGQPLTSQVREGVGSRWLVEHGVVADYAVVGEVSGFTIGTAQAGYLRLRIGVKGLLLYTPGQRRGEGPESNPNPFERAAYVVMALEQWSRRYEQERRYTYWGGVITPKAQVHEILPSGPPWTEVEDYCYIFLDIRLAPEQNPAEILHEVRQVVKATGLDCEVRPYDFQPGYTAENAGPLITAITEAHRTVFGRHPEPPDPVWISNWRDGNVFNGVGIPSVCYGPVTREPRRKGGGAAGETRPMLVTDLLATAKVFALTALDICGVVGE